MLGIFENNKHPGEYRLHRKILNGILRRSSDRIPVEDSYIEALRYKYPKPYGALFHLYDANLGNVCTATPIRSDVLLTAAHNYKNDIFGSDYEPVYRIVQGMHKKSNIVIETLLDKKIHKKYSFNEGYNDQYDLCLLFLANKENGTSFKPYPSRNYLKNNLNVWTMGYPSKDSDRLYFGLGEALETVKNLIGYNAAATPGMSGGGLFCIIENKLELIGMHVGDKFKAKNQFENESFKAIFFTEEILNWIDTSIFEFNQIYNEQPSMV